MADDPTRDELLCRLQARVAHLEATQVRRARHRRRPHPFLPLALVALLVALLPLSLLAASPFGDLTGGVHDANIGLIYDAGITRGCVPDVAYCPTDGVTRQEMASFLARTAGLGSNPPVANAKTAETATTAASATHAVTADSATTATRADTATTATGAGNATTVGGFAPNALLRVAQVVDTHRFDLLPQVAFPVTGNFDQTTPASSTYNDLVAVTLTAPAAGFVLVTGTVAFVLAPDNTIGFARLRDPLGGLASPVQLTTVAGGGARGTVAVTFVFPVAPGTRLFVLQVARSGSTTAADAYDGVVTALFVPFGHDGGTTLAP